MIPCRHPCGCHVWLCEWTQVCRAPQLSHQDLFEYSTSTLLGHSVSLHFKHFSCIFSSSPCWTLSSVSLTVPSALVTASVPSHLSRLISLLPCPGSQLPAQPSPPCFQLPDQASPTPAYLFPAFTLIPHFSSIPVSWTASVKCLFAVSLVRMWCRVQLLFIIIIIFNWLWVMSLFLCYDWL